MAELAAEGWQSDERFAEGYLRTALRKGYGPFRIAAFLREKGVAQEIIEATLAAFDGWAGLAEEVRARRFGGRPKTFGERARQARFLQSRGFAIEHMKGLFDEDHQ